MITYGNLAGRGLLEERHEMKERMRRLEDGLQITRTELQPFARNWYPIIAFILIDCYYRAIEDTTEAVGMRDFSEGIGVGMP